MSRARVAIGCVVASVVAYVVALVTIFRGYPHALAVDGASHETRLQRTEIAAVGVALRRHLRTGAGADIMRNPLQNMLQVMIVAVHVKRDPVLLQDGVEAGFQIGRTFRQLAGINNPGGSSQRFDRLDLTA